MPILSVPLGTQTGVRVQVRITINRAALLTLRQSRQPVPQPVIVEAVIDTGAERSCIDPSVATRAALAIYGFGLANAPGVPVAPLPALGGATVNTIHQASLAVLHPARGSDLVVSELIVQALPLRSFGIEAVIGRDVLASCVLVYNGPACSATLAY